MTKRTDTVRERPTNVYISPCLVFITETDPPVVN